MTDQITLNERPPPRILQAEYADNQQTTNWNKSHKELHKSRLRIASRSTRKHRIEGNFYLNGNSANLHARRAINMTQEEVMQLPEEPVENVGLFYGKVPGLCHQKSLHHGKTLKQVREMLQYKTDVFDTTTSDVDFNRTFVTQDSN